jgi:hypothetical protein
LQHLVIELCDGFDGQLKNLQNLKLVAEKVIFQFELQILKMGKTCLISEDDDKNEASHLKKREELKKLKIEVSADLPESKKEVERLREENEQALKRDKELEKEFKKEFHIYEFYIETLTKLYKRRSIHEPAALEDDLNPFAEFLLSATNVVQPPLDMKSDMPDGLAIDVWNKFVTCRDEKVKSEHDIFEIGQKYTEAKSFYQAALEESEGIRMEIDKINGLIQEFGEYKFQSTFNIETLMDLKQGQVYNYVSSG